MKMLIEKGILLKALKVMKKVILNSKYYPIYDNAIFGRHGKICMTSGRDDLEELELQIEFPSDNNDIGNESFLLPVKLFDSLCSVSEKKRKGRISLIDFQPAKDKHSVDISLDGIKTKMKIPHVDGYQIATIEEFSELGTFEVEDVPAFAEALKYTKIAISDDLTRESLRHMHFEWSGSENALVMVCTDGHRLHKTSVAVDSYHGQLEGMRFTMSNRFLDLLLMAIRQVGKNAKVEIYPRKTAENKSSKNDAYKFDRVYVKVTGDFEIVVGGNVSTQSFPEYSRVMPNEEEFKTILTIPDVMKFKNALKRATKLSGGDNSPIVFEVGQDTLSLLTRNIELGDSETLLDIVVRKNEIKNVDEEESEEANKDKEELGDKKLGINAKYVLEAVVDEIKGEIEIAYENVMSPVVFFNENGFYGLVMPMRV